jgi:nitrogen regulatory protein P-II 2
MKLVIAIIQPTRLAAVQAALEKAGISRMTVCDAHGFARQRGQTATFRGMEYKTHLLRKITLEIAINDDFVERTIDTICKAAKTGQAGNIGDGKIFVLPLGEAHDLGAAVSGPEAV